MPIAAFFYAYIKEGAAILARSSDIPIELVNIIQAIIMMLVVAEPVLLQAEAYHDGACGRAAADGAERTGNGGGKSMSTILESIFSASFLFSVIRITTPLMFGAMGATHLQAGRRPAHRV